MEEKSPQPAVDTNQIIEERRAKLRELRAGGNAFPNDFRRTHLAADLHRDFGAKSNEDLEPLALNVAIKDGRIKKGDLVLLEAMGGGFTWGSVLVRW